MEDYRLLRVDHKTILKWAWPGSRDPGMLSSRDVNKARGSKAKAKAKAPSLKAKAKAKACQFNPRPGQGQGRIP